MIKDISVLSNRKTRKGLPIGRACMQSCWQTAKRRKRQQEGKEILFIDETFLDYNKRNYGEWNLQRNYWNEGPNL